MNINGIMYNINAILLCTGSILITCTKLTLCATYTNF